MNCEPEKEKFAGAEIDYHDFIHLDSDVESVNSAEEDVDEESVRLHNSDGEVDQEELDEVSKLEYHYESDD